MTKDQNICYCGNYGGGMHTRSARCPGGELRTPQGEPALTSHRELPGTREPVVTAPKGNAGESPASLSSNERVSDERLAALIQYGAPGGLAPHDFMRIVRELQERRAIETQPGASNPETYPHLHPTAAGKAACQMCNPTKHDLSWALERVRLFDPAKGLMPYQEGMIAMATEIERLRNENRPMLGVGLPSETSEQSSLRAALEEILFKAPADNWWSRDIARKALNAPHSAGMRPVEPSRCTDCGVMLVPQARHFSGCKSHPGEPAVKAK